MCVYIICHVFLVQVTRKVIRKCVSADGVQHDEMSAEGGPQESFGAADEGGYSKLLKRTVVKSEGDHTEVCVLLVTPSVILFKLVVAEQIRLYNVYITESEIYLISSSFSFQVTFVELKGFPSSPQQAADSCEFSQTKKTTVVEDKRTLSSYGDPSLASDLPSDQDDIKQVCYQPLCLSLLDQI